MDDESTVLVERGLLTTSDETWNLAIHRAEVIGRLAPARRSSGTCRGGGPSCPRRRCAGAARDARRTHTEGSR